MKHIIYISGILGGILLILRLIGTIADFSFNDLILISGLVLVILVCIPMIIIDRYKNEKKSDHAIESHKDKPSIINVPSDKSKFKGWSMNNSPFRERKSGLNWGGGNIHGSNASRGNRRSFLK